MSQNISGRLCPPMTAQTYTACIYLCPSLMKSIENRKNSVSSSYEIYRMYFIGINRQRCEHL